MRDPRPKVKPPFYRKSLVISSRYIPFVAQVGTGRSMPSEMLCRETLSRRARWRSALVARTRSVSSTAATHWRLAAVTFKQRSLDPLLHFRVEHHTPPHNSSRSTAASSILRLAISQTESRRYPIQRRHQVVTPPSSATTDFTSDALSYAS